MSKQYDDLATELAALRRDAGGTRDEKIATAHALYGLLHYHVVQLARALKREDFDVSVYESTTRITLRLNGKSITVERFSDQSQVTFDFYGFDDRVLGPELRTQRCDVTALPLDEVAARAEQTVVTIGALWRADHFARRTGG